MTSQSTLTDPNKTVANYVTENPLTARIFHEKGIDFCCGGKVSLDSVCKEKNLNYEDILLELKEVKISSEEFVVTEDTTATEVVNYILKRYHDVLKQELPTLTFLMDKVSRVHGNAHPFLLTLRNSYMDLVSDLEMHMQKEEQMLFPLILSLDEAAKQGQKAPDSHCGSVNNPIQQMEYEHDTVGDILKKMRADANNYTLPENACNSFRGLFAGLEKMEQDLHLHIHTENNILHPMAQKLEG